MGAQILDKDNAYNFEKVLKKAVSTYGNPNKLYLDKGSNYIDKQIALIFGSIGTVKIHTPVRDGSYQRGTIKNFLEHFATVG